jgi:dipeptidyl aminopeptidase/acylaminoacyl peptidase
LDDPARFIRRSPFYRMNRVTTPTLLFWGEADRRVPVDQGWKYYRALQQTGKTDVRFVTFPGEGHSPTKLSTWRRALQEEIDWFDKYLRK